MPLEAIQGPGAMLEESDRLIERLFGDLGKFDNERLARHTLLREYCLEAGRLSDAKSAVRIGRAIDQDYVEWHLARLPYLRELSMLVEARAEVLARNWP